MPSKVKGHLTQAVCCWLLKPIKASEDRKLCWVGTTLIWQTNEASCENAELRYFSISTTCLHPKYSQNFGLQSFGRTIVVSSCILTLFWAALRPIHQDRVRIRKAVLQ